jgi:hypothetical protein
LGSRLDLGDEVFESEPAGRFHFMDVSEKSFLVEGLPRPFDDVREESPCAETVPES